MLNAFPGRSPGIQAEVIVHSFSAGMIRTKTDKNKAEPSGLETSVVLGRFLSQGFRHREQTKV